METTYEFVNNNTVKITVTCDKEMVANAFDVELKKACKNVEVKGFRKGHCPEAIYLKEFGEASLFENMINRLFDLSYEEAILENDLYVIGTPEIDFDFTTVSKNKEFTYTAKVEVIPEINLGTYKGIEVSKTPVNISEKEVNDYIENQLLAQQKEMIVLENVKLQNGHTAVFDFEGSVNGVVFEGGTAKDYQLKIGSGQFVPGFEEQMVGMEVGKEYTITITFPEDYHAELAGKEAQFKINLKEVKEEVTPELNDDLVEELSIDNVYTVDALKDYVLNLLTQEANQESENQMLNNIFEQIVNSSTFEIPESVIEYRVNQEILNLENQAKQYGLDKETLLKFSGISLEDYTLKVKEQSTKDLQFNLVINKISKQENITIEEQSIEDEYNLLAKQNNCSVNTVKQKYPRYNIISFLKQQKVCDLLVSNAKIK